MKRGELYRVFLGLGTDTKKQRVYVIVSRQELIDSGYSTLVCAPVYTSYEGLSTQVLIGVNEGLKHPSAIRCDELISMLKTRLTNYIGIISEEKLIELGQALAIALGIDTNSAEGAGNLLNAFEVAGIAGEWNDNLYAVSKGKSAWAEAAVKKEIRNKGK